MKAIVLMGDRHYQDQLATTIKSILYFNQQVRIYIFNHGISRDWFEELATAAVALESELVLVDIDAAEINPDWLTQAHISLMTYARYLIPRLVAEDRLVYLDSDLVVCGALDPLFELDLQGKKIAAVRDAGGSGFNAGVLVIDNACWREQNLTAAFIRETDRLMALVHQGQLEHFNGDQTVFNEVFQQDWLELDKIYNLQVGHDLVAMYSGWSSHFELTAKPLIVHYTTFRKPWNSQTSYRYRDLWWDFHRLSLQELLDHHQGGFELADKWSQAALHCMLLTNVQELEQFEFLVQSLPQVQFHIACYTEMGPYLLSLDAYENVHLYPEVVEAVLDELIDHCQVYLDIHHGTEQYQLSSRFAALGKPVLAFENTAKSQAAQVYSPEFPQELVAKLKRLLPAHQTESKAIVLAANYAYSDQVLTTIKSVCFHNHGVTFYLIHSDFPNEWFVTLNKKLAPMGSQIVNARVDASLVADFKTDISYTVFLRYFAADFVKEDKALYLDCDIVVTRDLTDLFATDLGDYPLAAVRDLGGQVYFGEEIFNAGVLLMNAALWRQEQVSQSLIRLTNEWHDQVMSGDQSILNMLFQNRWLELPFAYNCITLHKAFSDYQPEKQLYPPIIHYLTERKPWKDFTQSIYRSVWWFYNGLDWADMTEPIYALRKKRVRGEQKRLSCLVYTYSCELLHMEYLIQSLPQCHFYLAAPVVVADPISRLLAYDNVSVSSDIAGIPGLLDSLIDEADILLDINAGEEAGDIIARFRAAGKPVYAFDSRAHGQQGQEVFPQDKPEEMAAALASQAQQLAKEGQITVWSIDQTLDYILAHESSVIRYGDGEMELISGNSIAYQDYQPELAARLREILSQASSEKLVICLSDVFEGLERYSLAAQNFWKGHLYHYRKVYQEICRAPWYGSTFISRPYMDLEDKTPSTAYFAKLKQLWAGRDLLIVEGSTSRSGVGNDLFAGARSIRRIICPSRNAFSKYEAILQTIQEQAQDRLILLMLGPTAKLLAFDLAAAGHRVLDIGHIDSEYEWFQMGATSKVKLSHKHTAEHNFDEQIEFTEDADYEEQIVARLDT